MAFCLLFVVCWWLKGNGCSGLAPGAAIFFSLTSILVDWVKLIRYLGEVLFD
jgi:hypothetical protein